MIVNGGILNGGIFMDQYHARPILTDLQLYYDPSSYSGSGTSLDDLSGNNFTGTMDNIDTTGYSGHYFNYNGSNSSLSTPDMETAFNNTLAVTYEVWCNPTDIGCAIAETGTAGWYDNQMEVGGSSSPYYALCALYAGGVQQINPPGPNVLLNNWYQIVLTYDGSIGVSYINGSAGSPVGPFERQAPWNYSNGYILNFGMSTATAIYSQNWWSGKIGIVRAYNRGLTAEEVTQNFEATRGIYGI
jgi:hypothetical protein